MKKTNLKFFFVSLVFIFSCGDSEKFAPGIPTLKENVAERILTWESIAGASSYNIYIKTVTSCPDINAETFHDPTKSDTLIANVTSPFSIADYTGNTTCYYASLAAKNGAGESDLSIGIGWQIFTGP